MLLDHLAWIVPSLVAAVTIIIIHCDTNKQIKSNAKEQHRPFLTINHLKKENELSEGYLLIRTKSLGAPKMDNESKYLKINMKNIGHGVATKIKLFGITEGYDIIEFSSDDPRNESILSTLSVGPGDMFYINIIIPPDVSVNSFKFIFLYEDLNNNTYSAYLLMDSLQKAKAQYTLYPDNSSNFNEMIKKLKIDYDALIKKYKESN